MVPPITKMKGGETIPVPIDEVWDSIVKVIHLARLASFEESPHNEVRRAFLRERLEDLEGLTFNSKEKQAYEPPKTRST